MIRVLLIVAAVVMFCLALFHATAGDWSWDRWIALGLALLAGSFLPFETWVDRTPRRTS